MSLTETRARQQAEAAFAKVQSQFLTRELDGKSHDLMAHARAEKTLRLKAAREARDCGASAQHSVSVAAEHKTCA